MFSWIFNSITYPCKCGPLTPHFPTVKLDCTGVYIFYNLALKQIRSVGSDFAWEQGAPRSILASGTSFREDLVMKLFLRPFFLFRWFKKSICQLFAKGWALRTGNLPRGGLSRDSVERITDRPDMTSAVDRGRKALAQQQQHKTDTFLSTNDQIYSFNLRCLAWTSAILNKTTFCVVA